MVKSFGGNRIPCKNVKFISWEHTFWRNWYVQRNKDGPFKRTGATQKKIRTSHYRHTTPSVHENVPNYFNKFWFPHQLATQLLHTYLNKTFSVFVWKDCVLYILQNIIEARSKFWTHWSPAAALQLFNFNLKTFPHEDFYVFKVFQSTGGIHLILISEPLKVN